MPNTPVLLVHGIWDTAEHFVTIRAALHKAGLSRTRAMNLSPNDGSAPVATMAQQVAHDAETLAAEFEVDRIDLVGFSMGALASRFYIQRLGGRERVRRFVSIAGPHAGTLSAHFSWVAAGREMRPGSALLEDLARDEDPWGSVQAHAWITPFDLMIVPARSGVLKGAEVRTFPVAMHQLMIKDARVIDALVETLRV